MSDDEAKKFYEMKVVPLRRTQEVLVGYIRVDAQAIAQTAIDRLIKGEDFAAIADEYSNAKEFPRGVIPWNPESSYAPKQRSILRNLKRGELHRQPVEGVYGWEVWKLLESRSVPLPTFEQSRAQVDTYLANEKLCAKPK